jgi:hypothetical protein
MRKVQHVPQRHASGTLSETGRFDYNDRAACLK